MTHDSKSINVTFVLPKSISGGIGGMESVAMNLLHNLDSKYRCTLLSLSSRNGILPLIDDTKVDIKVIDQRQGLDPLMIGKMASYFLRTRPDLVHSFNFGALIYALPAAKIARVPAFVHAEHGRLPAEQPVLKRTRVMMMKQCDHVVPVSNSLRQTLVEEEGILEDRVSTIINGVDVSRFDGVTGRNRFRGELGIAPDDWVVGTVGSLSKYKNHQ